MTAYPRTLVTLLCAGLLLAGCSASPPPVNAPRPVVVESPQPLQGPGGLLAFPGTVHARTEADLSFRVPGKIAARRVDLGARVKPGQVLATLDPQDAKLNLEAARAALAAAEADAWLAQEEEKRYRELRARGHVGQSAVDQRIGTTRLAQARLEQARSQLDLARNQSQYTELRADVHGVVTQVIGEPGNVVAAGQPVLRIAADGEREVRITVPEGSVQALRESQAFVEMINHPGKRYAARVRDVSPQAARATRTHEARVVLAEPDAKVQLGATATVVLVSAADARTFRLPSAALGAINQDRAVVWAITQAEGGARVRPRAVQVLQYLQDSVVVSGDLKPDDRLVTAGVHLLVDQMPVRPIERSAKAAL